MKIVTKMIMLPILLSITIMVSGCGSSSDSTQDTSQSTPENENNIVLRDFNSSKISSIETIIDTQFNLKTDAKGLSIAIYKDGYEPWKYVKGFIDESNPLTTDTPFMIYSITKTIISAEILTLIEEGKINLDTSLEEALNGYTSLSSFNDRKINFNATIAQLLNHTSGIQEYTTDINAMTSLVMQQMFGTFNPSSLVNLVSEDFTNVGTHLYTNTNYILLGIIAEFKSGKNLQELLKTDLLTPLNIQGILLGRNNAPSNIAQPFDDMLSFGGSSVFGNLASIQQYFFQGLGVSTWSAGAMSMTAKDVAKWGYELYSNHGKAISTETRTILLNSISSEYDNYGYGVSTRNINYTDGSTGTVYLHGGNGPGYSALLHYNEELDISIAILVNTNNTTNNENIHTLTATELNNLMDKIFEAYKE